MKPARKHAKKIQFAICIDNRGDEVSLEIGKVYRRLADRTANKMGFVRIIDESEEDYLFPRAMFKLIRQRSRNLPGSLDSTRDKFRPPLPER
jgi:hypothetical protein